MIVPGAVRRDDQIASHGFAALALDVSVTAFLGENGAAGVGAVDVRRRDIAGRVDRDRAAHGGGDLQAPGKAGIGQQDALAVGEFDRRHVGAARNLVDAVEERPVVLPRQRAGSVLS